jgi:predicted transcriptional regulator
MGRPQGKTTVCTSFSLNKDVLARLNSYSSESLIPKTKIIEQAVTEWLDKRQADIKA